MIQQFPVGRHPTHLLANVQKNVLYVACMDDNAVWVCDLSNGEVKKVIPVKSGPFCLSLSSDGRILAVLCNGANSLQWIDTDLYEVVQTAKTGKEPHEVLFLHLF